MERLTGLELTNRILSAMDSDKVTTVDDTIEARQVYDTLLDVYSAILARRDWEFLKHNVRQLDANSNVVQLDIPEDVMHVELIRYKDFDTGFMRDLRYVSPQEFIRTQQALNTSDSNVEAVTVGSDSVSIGVHNDRAPTTWTSFDEDTITFNAYDSANEASGVTAASSTILATIIPLTPSVPNAYFDLPTRMYPLLFWEALSTCWLQIKQVPNQKAEQNARRQFIRMEVLERRTVADTEVLDYGRKPRRYTGIYSRR